MSSTHVQILRTGETSAPERLLGATNVPNETMATAQNAVRTAVVDTTSPYPRPKTGRYGKEQVFEFAPPEIVQEVLTTVSSIPHCKELAPDNLSSLVHHIALLAEENRARILESLPSLSPEQIMVVLENLKIYFRKHPSETGIVTKLLVRIQNLTDESPRQ